MWNSILKMTIQLCDNNAWHNFCLWQDFWTQSSKLSNMMSHYAQSYISMHRSESSTPHATNLCCRNEGGGEVECHPWVWVLARGWRLAICSFAIRCSTFGVRELLYLGLGTTKSLVAKGVLPGNGSGSTRAEEPQHCREWEAWRLLSLLHSLLGRVCDRFWW